MSKYRDAGLLVARMIFGLLFLLHGLMKFGSGMPKGLMLAAGLIEIAVGAALILGAFTVIFSVLGGLQMLVAYFMAHAPKGISPLANKGEPALLFFAAFLVFAFTGAGKYSLDYLMSSKHGKHK